MGYANIQADSNFYRQSLNADGIKDVTGPYTSLYEDVFRAITVTTDSVVSVTSYVGDSLSSQFLLAGTEIYGLFSSVTIHSGNAILHLAGASYISEIINQYSASGIPLGFYEEGTQCLSQKISALLTQGVFDDASWVMVPSQYKEDTVRAFKPTSELGNLAFTRSSDATFTDSTGVVRRSPWNLLQYSQDFRNVAEGGATNTWAANDTIILSTNNAAPNGTLTATRIRGTSGLNKARQEAITGISGLPYSGSIFIRRLSGTATIQLRVGDVGTFSTINPTSTWQRFTYTTTPTSTTVRLAIVFTNDTDEFEIWGAQLVEGTEALPYFATTDRLNVPRLDYRNADGTLSTCPRLLLEPQRTNSIRNSSMVGAVAGSPGTLPTNWSQFFGTGLTRTVVGTGTENGLPYVDVRFNGTVTTISTEISTETASAISVSNGQVWSNSAFIKIISAPLPPNSYSLKSYYWNGGVYVTESNTLYTPTTTLARYSAAQTVPAGTITHTSQSLRMNLTNGATYDFTIRIAAPQMELGAYATTWVPTTTAAVTRLADAFTRSNIFTNGLISAAGGTWIVDLSNNLSLTRDGASTSLSISTLSSDVFAGANGFEIRGAVGNRFEITKRISGTATLLFTTTTSNVKIAIKWNGTTADVFVNGVKQVSATAFTTTVMEFLKSFGADVPKYINQSLLAPSPLTDSECIALTTL